jgi:ABC-2 type transport system permease protein
MPAVLQKIADILPPTQGIKLLKAASLGLSGDGVLFSTMIMVFLHRSVL